MKATQRDEGLIKSDGWETSYYDIPAAVKDVDDIIIHFKLNWHMANILKACLRYGNKEGTSKEYDLNKIDFMSKRERENITPAMPVDKAVIGRADPYDEYSHGDEWSLDDV
ncbi:MAG: hypothetical protein ACXADL_16565 [Candidatus Thorarchaeota archaeon]|jgi:hypothetical protein